MDHSQGFFVASQQRSFDSPMSGADFRGCVVAASKAIFLGSKLMHEEFCWHVFFAKTATEGALLTYDGSLHFLSLLRSHHVMTRSSRTTLGDK